MERRVTELGGSFEVLVRSPGTCLRARIAPVVGSSGILPSKAADARGN
jgi:hypothetical protein